VTASNVGSGFLLIVHTKGENPLHDTIVDMVDMDKERATPPSSFTWETVQGFTRSYPSIPGLASSSARVLDTIPIGTMGDARNLHFNFFSINGAWHQRLNLRIVDGRWIQATRVWKDPDQSKNKQMKILYEDVPPNYPKANGKVDW